MRKSTNIVVFYLFFTGAAALLETAQITTAMGVSVDGSVPAKLEKAKQQMSTIESGGGFGETLWGLYNAVASSVEVMFAAVSAGPRLLTNAGVPPEITAFLFAPAVIIIGVDIAYALSGRDL